MFNNKFLLTIVLVVFIVGCKKSDNTLDKKRVLNIFNWEEYIGSETIDIFTKETGIEVHSYYYEDEDSMLSELINNSSLYDLIVASDDLVRELKERKLLHKLDVSKIKNINNIDNRYLNLEFDPNQEYSVPYLWGTTGFVINTKYVKERDWDVLFNKKYKNKIALLNNQYEVVSAAFKYKNKSINPTSLSDFDDIRDLLFEQKSLVKGYFDVYTLQDMLVNEVIWVAQMYSGEGIGSTELNGDLSYIIPDKGAPIWLDCFVISRDSQNLSEAYEFLNYILRAEINAEIATELWYATPNKEALKYLEKDFLEIKEIFLTDNVLDRCEYYKDIGVLKNEINKIWYKLEE